MKSVVVEGATLAKAIEAAWNKAGKPEEFFIRVLQEHVSGFLGFGAKKSKIVLFFKNTNKSDSLYPPVLKQREYTNFFDNKNLKNPTELNVVDTQLNKNTIIGSGQKKKAHHAQQNSSHNKNVEAAKVVTGNANNQQKNNVAKPHVQANLVQNKTVQHDVAKQQPLKKVPVHNHAQANQAKQVKHSTPQQEKHLEKKAMIQVSLQAPVQGAIQQKQNKPVLEKKEDVVNNMTNVLKKVQSQKFVANVSRSAKVISDVDKASLQKHHAEKVKVVVPKFETYAEFMDAQVDKAAAKVQPVLEQVEKIEKVIIQPVDSIVAKIESLHVEKVVHAPVVHVDTTVAQQDKPVIEKRPFIKMKRRPLTTDNPGVSGITRSVDKKEDQHGATKNEQDVLQKNDQV